MTSSAVPSKRCFFCDLPTITFVANSRETVRLMGVAVYVKEVLDDVIYPECHVGTNPSSFDYENLMLLTLDDGTGE